MSFSTLRGLKRTVNDLGSTHSHVLLDLSNRLGRVQTLRACPRAVENSVATVEGESVLQLLTTLIAVGITRVSHPAVSLHQNSGAEVSILVPPVRRARSRAAGTQNALVQAIKVAALFRALQIFLTLRRGAGSLQVWLNAAVLLVELGHIGNEVFDDVHVRQRVDVARAGITVNTAETGKGVDAVNVHGAATTNTLAARAAEGQGRVNLVLDLQKGVENHGARLVQIDIVGLHPGLLSRILRVLLLLEIS